MKLLLAAAATNHGAVCLDDVDAKVDYWMTEISLAALSKKQINLQNMVMSIGGCQRRKTEKPNGAA